jgi:hypothetical protein
MTEFCVFHELGPVFLYHPPGRVALGTGRKDVPAKTGCGTETDTIPAGMGRCLLYAANVKTFLELWGKRYKQPRPAGMDAGCDTSLGLWSKPAAQKRHGCHMPAQPGRHGCRREQFPGFAKQTHSPETTWMSFQGSARDRSGNTGSPDGAEELERIARSGACAGCAHLRLEMRTTVSLQHRPKV